ncbi:hypothetical protein Q7C36_000327 [Tachysurus vachellii]|uniref:Splicing factor cactin central domain-containing protein n=1 Tax=Tachysurus vachellii TaxID=175792 RepID=A0AA88NZ07_TACVA|nr:hypothetical protein Q7C36_000327 [Tachysurus vachellii]
MGWREGYMGYTNEDHLYGDNNLQATFKWQKVGKCLITSGKTYSQLKALNMNIESQIQVRGSNLDIGYWASLMQQVQVYMARARERHQDVLRQKLYKLKQEQGVESGANKSAEDIFARHAKEGMGVTRPSSESKSL